MDSQSIKDCTDTLRALALLDKRVGHYRSCCCLQLKREGDWPDEAIRGRRDVTPTNAARMARAADILSGNGNQHSADATEPPSEETYPTAEPMYVDVDVAMTPDELTTRPSDSPLQSTESPPPSSTAIDDLVTNASAETTSTMTHQSADDVSEAVLLISSSAAPLHDDYLADYQPGSTSQPDYEDTTALDKNTVRQTADESLENNQMETNSTAVGATNRSAGRALSHDDDHVGWMPKSTKIIGTIIQDIEPFEDDAAVLTAGGITAISLCISLVLITTAGTCTLHIELFSVPVTRLPPNLT